MSRYALISKSSTFMETNLQKSTTWNIYEIFKSSILPKITLKILPDWAT